MDTNWDEIVRLAPKLSDVHKIIEERPKEQYVIMSEFMEVVLVVVRVSLPPRVLYNYFLFLLSTCF